jgi:peptidoglycan/xylan/chitin deacetylase (PgdA/CDA1 family)
MILKFLFSALLFFFWSADPARPQEIPTKEQILGKFSGRVPHEWGEVVKGVKTRLDTDQKVLALTFDACGGPKGSGYDAKLIDFLTGEAIPATLFISGKWMDANPEIFQTLSSNPLFEIENHGLTHRPCSATGRSVYGIKGTKNMGEIYDEIEGNALKILIALVQPTAMKFALRSPMLSGTKWSILVFGETRAPHIQRSKSKEPYSIPLPAPSFSCT